MADSKLTALTELTAPVVGDQVYVVDVSDTTDDAAGSSRRMALDKIMALLGAETSVTGATTATIGKMHVCSGTTSDYTVTLPAASGNTGRLLGFRMAPGLTKLVTLDGNSSETIDGATTRVMWAEEACLLLCDGSNWFKIAGKARPFVCGMLRNTTTSVATATATKLGLNETITDNSGLMADAATNTRINVRRAGVYEIRPQVTADASAITAAQARVHKNGSFLFNLPMDLPAYGGMIALNYFALAAGDYIELYTYHASGSNRTYAGSAGDPACSLTALEVPQW